PLSSSFSPRSRATSAISTLSLHDALPILPELMRDLLRLGIDEARRHLERHRGVERIHQPALDDCPRRLAIFRGKTFADVGLELRSEEHTSELQSRENLVCRRLLEKKKLQQ